MKAVWLFSTAVATMMTLSSAFAAPGTVLRDEKLYASAASNSKVVASVSRGSAVDIVTKQGGWLKVKAGKTEGWIRLLSVRAGTGGVGGAGVGDVVGAATTKSDPTRVVAVAGLRGLSQGLDEEQLKQAQFNAEELARVEANAVKPSDAKTRAARSGLVATNIARLPDPKAAASKSSSPWEVDY
jgi:hypothetical protein